MAAEHEPVVGDGPTQEHGGQRSEQKAGHVQGTLRRAQPDEADREGQREEEAEQDLDAETGHPQFLQELSQIPVVSLGLRFMAPGVVAGAGCLVVHGQAT